MNVVFRDPRHDINAILFRWIGLTPPHERCQMAKEQQSGENEPFGRWTAQRKATIILEILKGQLSVPEAARKYGFTQGEYRKWADEFMRREIVRFRFDRSIRLRNLRPSKRRSEWVRLRRGATSRSYRASLTLKTYRMKTD